MEKDLETIVGRENPKESRKSLTERAKDYVVDTTAAWIFYTPVLAASEYLLAGMEPEEAKYPSVIWLLVQPALKSMGHGISQTMPRGKAVGMQGSYAAFNRRETAYNRLRGKPLRRGEDEEISDSRDRLMLDMYQAIFESRGPKTAYELVQLMASDPMEAAHQMTNVAVVLHGFSGNESVLNGQIGNIKSVDVNPASRHPLVVELADTQKSSIIHEDDRKIKVSPDEVIVIGGSRRESEIADIAELL